jgi:peptide/nickel transport system ATP-binding protein
MERIVLQGEVPNPADPPSGCHFHPRCQYRTEQCVQVKPALQKLADGRHVACHYADELQLIGIEEIAAGEDESSHAEG